MAGATDLYEKLGVFYLGRPLGDDGEPAKTPLLYDSRDLVTHAMCVGMTGSGKTGLLVTLLEEAAIDGVPSIVVDVKGDLANLLLTFPDLRAEDFRPWIDEGEASRRALSPDALAAQTAERWRSGLAEWDQDGARIRRLREAADFAVYTPGSDAVRPLSILASFAPPADPGDADAARERIAGTVSSLLGLLGLEADPLRSREHILIASLFEDAWKSGRALDLGSLVQGVHTPPFDKLGVMPLESFFPAKDRGALAIELNALLASPGFASWLAGEALDVDALLHAADGRPRVSIVSIAHLSDAERMFFVSLLLGEVLGWMRRQSGTASLRAILAIDEIFGYLPPVAEPPSKRALLTLLKQARAFGLGVVLATQNPVDLDYKALSNIGTWFLGRLQTERDLARVAAGLEGVQGSPPRADTERLLAGLGKRTFLLHDVHEDGPVVFQVRWAMSYLAGPLSRGQLRRLAPAGAPAPTSALSPATRASATAAPTGGVVRPGLPAEAGERFAPGDASLYAPRLLLEARLAYPLDRKTGREHVEEIALLATYPDDGGADWQTAEPAPWPLASLGDAATTGAGFAPLPAAASQAVTWGRLRRDATDALIRSRRLTLLRSSSLDLVSEPGEDDRAFRIRLAQRGREARDARLAELRQRYAPKIARVEDEVRRTEAGLEREQAQSSQAKLDTVLTMGTAILGGLFGRRSGFSVTRIRTATRGVGRTLDERRDVAVAEERLDVARRKLQALEEELQRELESVESNLRPETEPLEPVLIEPRKKDVEVRTLALVWVPAG